MVCIGDDPHSAAQIAHGGDQGPLVALWVVTFSR